MSAPARGRRARAPQAPALASPSSPVFDLDAPLAETLAAIAEHITATHRYSDLTLKQEVMWWRRLCGYCVAVEITTVRQLIENVDEAKRWVRSRRRDGQPTSIYGQKGRSNALQVAYRVLLENGALLAMPPTNFVDLSRARQFFRPVTTEEMEECQEYALAGFQGVRPAVALAITQATALTSEVAAITIEDFNLRRGWVELPGARDLLPRRGNLTEWGVEVLGRHFRENRPTGFILGGRGSYAAGKQYTLVGQVLQSVMEGVGLRGQPNVSMRSLRSWVPRKRFDEGAPIHEVAQLLGCRSLDTAAFLIGFEWMDEG